MEDNNGFYDACNEEEKDDSIIDEEDHIDKARKNDAAKEQEGRFTYSEINDYLLSQKYPVGFTKADKLALRKRAKFFKINDGQLYYTGRGK